MAHKEEPIAINNQPAGMNVATFSVGQDLRQKDLVRGKKGQRVQITFPKYFCPVVVYPGPGVVVVKDDNSMDAFVSF
jgi:hypothetical protein